MASDRPELNARPELKSTLAWGLLAAGVMASLLAAAWLYRGITDTASREFAFTADQVSHRIKERLLAHELILRGAAALFNASDRVTRAEWRAYTEKLDADTRVPGLQGIGFSLWIAPGQLAAHEADIRNEGFPDYRVTPQGERDSYTAIVFLEPFRDRNLRAFGYDMFSEPVRRAAMISARDSGAASLSGKVILLQETGRDIQAGALMYVPVYRQSTQLVSIEQRRAALVGWAYSPFRMNDLMSGILTQWDSPEGRYASLRIFDGTTAADDNLLYGSPGKPVHGVDSAWHQQRIVHFNDHDWLLEFRRSQHAPAISYAPVAAVLLGGLLLSGLLSGLVFSLANTRNRASRIADQLTRELRQRDKTLEESEYRWRFAIEGSGDGLWDWNIPENTVFFSPRWKSMLGHSETEIGNSLDEWKNRIHPEDLEATLKVVTDYLQGNTPFYVSEHRVRCKDGHYKWILDRGIIVARDAEGKPTRMIGTHSDVTQAIQTRLHIEHLSQLYAALNACNQAAVHCTSEDALFARICEVIVRFGGMKMAWIGLIEPATGRIVPTHSFGEGTDYLDGIEVSVHAEDPHGQGPTGIATRDNHPVWYDDFQHNPGTAPWHERGKPYGWAAAAAIPICRAGLPIGAMTFYSGKSGWIDNEIRALFVEMAQTISFALDKLDAEAEADRYQATLVESEQRFRSLIEQSIAGAFIVQDGGFVYLNPRMGQILGHPQSDVLLGKPLLSIVAGKDRLRIETEIQQILDGDHTSAELLFSAERGDGSTVDVGITSSLATYQSRKAIIGLMQDMSDRKVAEDQIRRYAKQLEHTFMQTVGLANTLSEMRDPYTVGHERRVAEIAVAIGRELGLDGNQLEGLRVGGYLHDVGKMVIPAEILAKPGRLTPVEYELIKAHPRAGFDVLKEVEFPWPVALIALQHHERIDGSGYPQGLKGDAIILEARIIAVADVLESMAAHRPYRPGMGIEKALAEIEAGIGTRYDPHIARACLGLFRDKGYQLTGLT